MLTSATERLAAARTALRRAEQRTGLANRVSRDIRHSEPHASAVNWRGEAHSDPWLGLNADSVGAVAVIGSTSILLAAAARRQGPHGWCAVLGADGIGWCAASESGLALDRVLAVRTAGLDSRTLLSIAGTLLDGVDVLLLSPQCATALRVREHRSLSARSRERGALLLSPVPWEGARTLAAAPQSVPPNEGGAVLALHSVHPHSRTAVSILSEPSPREMPEGYLCRLRWSLRNSAGPGASQVLLDSMGIRARSGGAEPRSDAVAMSGRGA